MIFVALLYSQFELKETIVLDLTKKIIPLGYSPLRDLGHGMFRVSKFKFAYVENGLDSLSHPMSNIGFTDTRVKTFLEFFSFLTNDGWSISEFEGRQEGARYFNTVEEVDIFLDSVREHEVVPKAPSIESEFSIQYSFHTLVGKINFVEAWNMFVAKEEKYRDMVSLYCARFTGPTNNIYEVFNKDTTNLFFSLILIEGLMTPRINCSGKLNCSACGDILIKHNSQTTNEYWKSELNRKLKFSDGVQYINLIISLYQEMRHSFAHGGELLPDAKRVVDPKARGPHTRLLQLPNVITDMNKDSLARANVRMIMHDIVWFLLMSVFFPSYIDEPWPDLGLIKEYHSG